jgi:hypothetical protein
MVQVLELWRGAETRHPGERSYWIDRPGKNDDQGRVQVSVEFSDGELRRETYENTDTRALERLAEMLTR